MFIKNGWKLLTVISVSAVGLTTEGVKSPNTPDPSANFDPNPSP